MIINKLDIIGYGKWIDKTFDVHPKLQIFYGKNESGKSTLISFIQSILFGFPTRNQKMNRYEPMKTSKYGGRLHVSQTTLGDAVIERLGQTKVTGNVKIYSANRATLDDSFLSNMLYKIDSTLYRNTFSFNLSDLEKINQLTPEELEADFLNMSVTGANDYLTHAKQLSDKADRLYKPGGRVLELNKAIDQLKEQEHVLSVAESKNKHYLNQLEEFNQIDNKIKQKIKEIETLKTQSQQLQFLISNWSKYERYQHLTNELQQNNQIISQDDRLIFEKLMAESQELSTKIDVLNNELKHLQDANFSSDVMDEYVMNKLCYTEQFKRLPYLRDLSSKYQQIELKLEEKSKHQQNLRYQLNLDQTHDVPIKITDDESLKLTRWKNSFSENNEEIRKLEEELYKHTYQIEMMDKQTHKQENPRFFNGLFISIIVFVVLTLIGWLSDFNLPIIILSGAVGAGISYHLMKAILTNKQLNITDEDEYRLELKDRKTKIEKNMSSLRSEMETLTVTYKNFLKGHHLDPALSIDEVLSKRQFYNEFIHQSAAVKQLEHQRDELDRKLSEATESLDQLTDLYPINYSATLKIHNLNQMKDKVDAELKQNEESIQEINYVTKQLHEFNAKAEVVDTQLDRLMDKYQLDSIIKLNQLIKQSNRLDESKDAIRSLESIFTQHSELLDSEHNFKYDDIQDQLNKLQNEIELLNEQRDALFDKKSTLKLEMNELEEGREYALILQKYENQVSVVNDLTEQWLVHKVASDIVSLTIRQGIKEELPSILESATDFFNRLTLGNYRDIRFENNRITVVNGANEEFNISDLSRGTAEPLYAALRLAVIQFKANEMALPVLIDDSFVNVDSIRRGIIYDILEEISQDIQVILFTFDDNVLNRFSNDQITRL